MREWKAQAAAALETNDQDPGSEVILAVCCGATAQLGDNNDYDDDDDDHD